MTVPPELPGEDEPRAADGRVPGRRGLATRQRLVEQTAELLRTTAYRDLKVVDIARAAGTSPATFYQYFPEVEAAILVVAEDLVRTGGQQLCAIVRDGDWRGRAAYGTSAALVAGMMELWEEGRATMRVVDLATDEGDPRFRRLRNILLNELTKTLADVIADASRTGRHPADLDPMATAGVLVSMMAHVASHRYGFEFWGIRTHDAERSMARIVYTTVTGQRPPPGA